MFEVETCFRIPRRKHFRRRFLFDSDNKSNVEKKTRRQKQRRRNKNIDVEKVINSITNFRRRKTSTLTNLVFDIQSIILRTSDMTSLPMPSPGSMRIFLLLILY